MSTSIRTAARTVAFAATLAWALAAPLAHAQQPAVPPNAPAAAAPVQPPASTPVGAAVPAPAAPQTIGTTDTGARVGFAVPHELSPWSMFMAADIIVKLVMVGLAFASLVTWTVFIAKTVEFTAVDRRLRNALDAIKDARSLAEARVALGSDKSVLSHLLAAALREARLSAGLSSDTGIKERAASSFGEITRAEARRMRAGMGILATIGATSPFVGLFGTVWGIMNSFIGISLANTTNLAVVAPGIAESLLATAMGLVAAIPAVVIYNHLVRATAAYRALLGDASAQVLLLVSRARGGRQPAALRAAE